MTALRTKPWVCAALAAAGLSCLAAGCAPAPRGAADHLLSTQFGMPEPDPSFEHASRLLAGVDQSTEGPAWACEDWILLGVKASRRTPDGARHEDVWFVRLSTLPSSPSLGAAELTKKPFIMPFTLGAIRSGTRFVSPAERVSVETFDHNGTFLRSSIRTVPLFPPTVNLLDVCRQLDPNASVADRSSRQDPDPCPVDTTPDVAALVGAMRSIVAAGALEPVRTALRRDMVETPSVVDYVLNGLRMSVETNLCEVGLVVLPWSSDSTLAPGYQAHFPVVVAGQRMFDCHMIVGPSRPPYHLTGGVLLLETAHPEKPDNRITIRVLAAKRTVCMD